MKTAQQNSEHRKEGENETRGKGEMGQLKLSGKAAKIVTVFRKGEFGKGRNGTYPFFLSRGMAA